MICPECHGSGQTVASHVHYADGRGACNVPMLCLRCKGAKVVPDETPAWIALGRRMRNARVCALPYRKQSEEARLRGMDTVTLSQMEQGYIEPIPGDDFAEREASALSKAEASRP